MALKAQSRFTFIDALRGIASVSVVLFHLHGGVVATGFPSTFPQFIQTILKQGYLGVQVFFVLSGFVIAYSLRNARINLAYFGNFMLRRLVRLSPAYWMAIALVVFLRYASNFILVNRVAPLPSWQQLAAQIFYLQDILNLGNISAVFWTISIEVQFYLVFCILLATAQRLSFICNSYQQILLTFGAASLLAAAWPLGLVSGNLFSGLFVPYLYMFLLGAFTWWALERKIPVACFIYYLLLIFTGAVINCKVEAIFAALTTIVIYLVGIRGNLQDWLNLGWLQYLGQISYSLYLTHATVILPVLNVGHRLTGDSKTGSFWWILIALIVSWVTAHCSWKFIEKPSVEFSRCFKLIAN